MSATLLVALFLAQSAPTNQNKVELPVLPSAEPSKLGPGKTAFPELRVPHWDDFASDTLLGFRLASLFPHYPEEQLSKERRAMFAKATSDLLPGLPKDATLLQKVQYQQVREGLSYLRKNQEMIDIGAWQPEFFADAVKVSSDLCRLAAELHDTPAGRVRCFETRVLLLKELELLIYLRVAAGQQLPQDANKASLQRLQAEADLLKLKAEIEKAGKK